MYDTVGTNKERPVSYGFENIGSSPFDGLGPGRGCWGGGYGRPGGLTRAAIRTVSADRMVVYEGRGDRGIGWERNLMEVTSQPRATADLHIREPRVN